MGLGVLWKLLLLDLRIESLKPNPSFGLYGCDPTCMRAPNSWTIDQSMANSHDFIQWRALIGLINEESPRGWFQFISPLAVKWWLNLMSQHYSISNLANFGDNYTTI